MNAISIDYGNKRIGLAISIQGIIQPLCVVRNDDKFLDQLNKVILDYQIEKIFVGISQGEFAIQTKKFVDKLKHVITLPIETVEEAVSTIEADQIYLANKKPKKDYKKNIDAIAAAVILKRVIG
ncbi:MAG: Holliday junction resolvase RuvX [Candidatus Shapirobacteria bacterium]|nr:Holliday junction resolvase RuvX [Candidatus Shapirobacteria bacterium]